jgi:DNA polymerase-1
MPFTVNNKDRTLLIDGDIVLYKFACTHYEVIEWDEGIESEVEKFDEAVWKMEGFIKSLLKHTGCIRYRLCFTGDFNFRYLVMDSYKHNRADMEKPELHAPLKEYLMERHKYYEWKWLEADDVMGILSTGVPGKYIIATIDKDLKQIPGMHYNWNHPDDGVVNVSPLDADKLFYQQILTGDPTDGYKGCPGVGKVKAQKIVNKFTFDMPNEERWELVMKPFEHRGIPEEYALMQARVARILRSTDYDKARRKPILWHPDVCLRENLVTPN